MTLAIGTSCGGSGESKIEPITTSDLAGMIVPKGELDGDFAGAKTVISGPQSNASVITDTVDPSDTAETLAKAGRITGYGRLYGVSDTVVGFGLDLFDDESAAAAFVSQTD